MIEHAQQDSVMSPGLCFVCRSETKRMYFVRREGIPMHDCFRGIELRARVGWAVVV